MNSKKSTAELNDLNSPDSVVKQASGVQSGNSLNYTTVMVTDKSGSGVSYVFQLMQVSKFSLSRSPELDDVNALT